MKENGIQTRENENDFTSQTEKLLNNQALSIGPSDGAKFKCIGRNWYFYTAHTLEN